MLIWRAIYSLTCVLPLQQTTFDTEPSYSYEEEHSEFPLQLPQAEQPAFEFMERESDWEHPQHARNSSAGLSLV